MSKSAQVEIIKDLSLPGIAMLPAKRAWNFRLQPALHLTILKIHTVVANFIAKTYTRYMAKTKELTKSKPILNPQQALFLACLTDPNSPTFGNYYQSALKAKYSDEYANTITTKNLTWLSGNVGDLALLQKAETVLKETLETNHIVQAMGAFGPLYEGKGKRKKPILKVDVGILGVKNKSAQFVAETLGKKKYSKKVELEFTPVTPEDFAEYA